MGYYQEQYLKVSNEVIQELDMTLRSIEPESVERLVNEILEADQVFFVGVGRVLLALQCIMKRLAHLGIKTHYVGEITEPAFTDKDLLIVGSVAS